MTLVERLRARAPQWGLAFKILSPGEEARSGIVHLEQRGRPLKRPWGMTQAKGTAGKQGTTADLDKLQYLDVLESRSMSCGVQKAACKEQSIRGRSLAGMGHARRNVNPTVDPQYKAYPF